MLRHRKRPSSKPLQQDGSMIQPGEVTLCLHELWDRHGKIPDVDDCYLVRVWSDDISFEEGQDPEDDVFPPVPYLASRIDALINAREHEELEEGESWDWGWDGSAKNNRVRFQGNSSTITHPIYLTFRWGYGAPTGASGAKMLPHEVPGKYQRFCRHCGYEVGSVPKDCPTLRMRALADIVKLDIHSSEIQVQLAAVDEWHRKSRSLED